MFTITFVVGARPNFVKIAPILKAMAAYDDIIRPKLVHTGQHYSPEMSGVFFEELEIPVPDVSLDVGAGPHGQQTGRILEAFESHLLSAAIRTDLAVVVGDVNSTVACALAATKLGIAVAHVEAGLRSFDRTMPEEINRIVTDAIADILFVSEPSGEENLRLEGASAERIHYVGNVMIDALVQQMPAAVRTELPEGLERRGARFGVVTLHRPANVDSNEALKSLTGFLTRISRNITLVFPLHPRTRKNLASSGYLDVLENNPAIVLCGPLPYRQNLHLISRAAFVLTDSGGMQEETTFLGIPCLTLRSNTERPITVSRGTNIVIGSRLDKAEQLVEGILRGDRKTSRAIPGWDGHAAERIAAVLADRVAGCMCAKSSLVERTR